MSINLRELQQKLIEHKVYDAWQYVNSLVAYINYMHLSFELVKAIDKQRISILNKRHRKAVQTAYENKTNVIMGPSYKTNMVIGELNINDIIFQQKNVLEFFHYARISIDSIFQIVNVTLLGDDALDNECRQLNKRLIKKLENRTEYNSIRDLLENNKSSVECHYIQAFNNYTKHISVINIDVKNNIIKPDDEVFKINEFTYKKNHYDEQDALLWMDNIYKYIIDYCEDVLRELTTTIKHCTLTKTRIHDVAIKTSIKEKDGKRIDQAAYFVDVDSMSGLSDFIQILPIKTGDYDMVYCSAIPAETVFIRNKGTSQIIGIAKLVENTSNKEDEYREYNVSDGSEKDYEDYLNTPESEKAILNFNMGAARWERE